MLTDHGHESLFLFGFQAGRLARNGLRGQLSLLRQLCVAAHGAWTHGACAHSELFGNLSNGLPFVARCHNALAQIN